jgi:hypothetical protein
MLLLFTILAHFSTDFGYFYRKNRFWHWYVFIIQGKDEHQKEIKTQDKINIVTNRYIDSVLHYRLKWV